MTLNWFITHFIFISFEITFVFLWTNFHHTIEEAHKNNVKSHFFCMFSTRKICSISTNRFNFTSAMKCFWCNCQQNEYKESSSASYFNGTYYVHPKFNTFSSFSFAESMLFNWKHSKSGFHTSSFKCLEHIFVSDWWPLCNPSIGLY